MTTGQRLRKARERLGKRQADIARELGKTQPAIADWEGDKSEPRLRELRRVARAYGLRPETLIPREGRS